QGDHDDDVLMHASLQLYIAQILPWINYNELLGVETLSTRISCKFQEIVKAPFLEKD
ncbi:unnamed protein product, partial [Dovyalis caffra]